MRLGPLFDGEESTSARALREITEEGLLGRMQVLVLRYVRAHPGGVTGRECDDAIRAETGDAQSYHKRLSELAARGLVVPGEPRPCRVTGRQAKTWRARGYE